jgi:ubiquinone/menaquinone biosynthesis C-methylase UbiE
MPSSVNKSAAPAADYDSFAAAYSASNENNLFNAYYARPEMIRLAGDVAGLNVLDVGCGSGPLMEALRAKDAVVSGFDLSPAMVELARQRLSEDADVRVADLGAPLPYPDHAFDLVVASLSLHYVKDWASALAELRRVLKPGGRLIVSIIHPTVYAIVYRGRLLRPHPVLRGLRLRRRDRVDDLLAPAPARRHQHVHGRGVRRQDGH